MLFFRLVGRVVSESLDDGILDWAAAVSFYLLFALFPALLFIASLVAALHLRGTDSLVIALQRQLPRTAGRLVATQVDRLLKHAGSLLSLSTLLLLYSASQGYSGMTGALNAAYEVRETRPYWKRLLLSWALTITAGLLQVIALLALLTSQRVLVGLASLFHLSATVPFLWPVLRWVIVVGTLYAAVALIYRYVPNVQLSGRARRRGFVPAVATALVLWAVASVLLGLYIDHFANYATIYGSLGAVIALMLWFYVSALALFLGAEVHSEQMKLAGDRPPRPKAAAELPRAA